MAIRENIVASAVTFLQDPSVANAPLDKRIAFLQSKNLTQEEIDASLARAGDGSVPPPPPSAQSQVVRQGPPPPNYGYGYPQNPYGYWGQPPPPEVPRRDWRDWFIMATVLSGVGYGCYFVAKRYISPLIAPPTPDQLTQDKQHIDESFDKAFALIEQLSKDTDSIKSAEEGRKERLDTAINDFETQMKDLKESSRRRDEDTRRIAEEVRRLQDMIPKAMKNQAEGQDGRLKELREELKSLKTLVSNRMSSPAPAPAPVNPSPMGGGSLPGGSASVNSNVPSRTSTPPATTNGSSGQNGVVAGAATNNGTTTSSESLDTKANGTANRFGRSARGGIPAWQLAASNQNGASANNNSSNTEAVAQE